MKNRIDIWLERVTFGVALVRVLRGDDPKRVSADVDRINNEAVKLRTAIQAAMNERAPAPSSEGSKPDA